MKNIAQLGTLSLLLSALLFSATVAADANPSPTVGSVTPSLPKTPPNNKLNVQRQKGICPKTVSFWTAFRYYEGGGENTFIANTSTIAGLAKIRSSSKTFVEYEAPLQEAYASCIGRASLETEPEYKFWFRTGNLYLRVDLTAITKNSPTMAEITYKGLIDSRPYIRWAVAD